MLRAMAGNDPQRVALDALASILPAVEQILSETWNVRTRDAAERIILAAQRLMPEAASHPQTVSCPQLQARPTMASLLPRLQQMLSPAHVAAHRTPELTLFIEAEPLQRLVTQLMLHGRQCLVSGTVTVTCTPVTLGSRSWARLGLELTGPPAKPPSEYLGLSWLQQTVREALGMLEMAHDPQGRLRPRIYLPCKSLEADPAATSLQGRRIAIFDREATVRDTLEALVRGAGGEALSFATLRDLLESTRTGLPDLLVLERTPALERCHKRLRSLAPRPLPALILGDGRALPAGEGAPARLILLEKPFPGQNFLQCLLALLQES